MAIAVSVDVYNRIGGVGDVGGIVGTAVSASVLFLLGVANSAILYNILRNRRKVSRDAPRTKNKTHNLIICVFLFHYWNLFPLSVAPKTGGAARKGGSAGGVDSGGDRGEYEHGKKIGEVAHDARSWTYHEVRGPTMEGVYTFNSQNTK